MTTVSLSAFTAEDPATAQASPEDVTAADGQLLTFTVTAGTPEASAILNGNTFAASALDATTLALDVSLLDIDVTDLAATAETSQEIPPDYPDPNHQQASMSPGVTTRWHPSPGVGGVPVEPNPEDTAPGTESADETVPDPEAPLDDTRRLSNAEALAKIAEQRAADEATEEAAQADDPQPEPEQA